MRVRACACGYLHGIGVFTWAACVHTVHLRLECGRARRRRCSPASRWLGGLASLGSALPEMLPGLCVATGWQPRSVFAGFAGVLPAPALRCPRRVERQGPPVFVRLLISNGSPVIYYIEAPSCRVPPHPRPQSGPWCARGRADAEQETAPPLKSPQSQQPCRMHQPGGHMAPGESCPVGSGGLGSGAWGYPALLYITPKPAAQELLGLASSPGRLWFLGIGV